MREVAAKGGLYVALYDWAKRYGKVYKMWMGKLPMVVLTDVALIHTVCVKRFTLFSNRGEMPFMPLRGKAADSAKSEVLLARQPLWGSLRAALQPMFHTKRLQSYCIDINLQAEKLRRVLEPAAASGSGVEVWRPLGRTTLDVICKASFGQDFAAQETALRGDPDTYLVRAVRTIFGSARSVPSMAAIAAMCLPPGLDTLARWTRMYLLWDTLLERAAWARTAIASTADFMLTNAQAREAAAGGTVRARDDSWKWWREGDVADNPYRDAVPVEGSLIDMLAKARSKASAGGHLSDVEVVINAFEMIAAGYETTANTLAFVLYSLAANPEAQQALAAEVDAFGGDRPVAYEDMAGFPYAEAVVKETLRLYPAAPFVAREAAENVLIEGYMVPKGGVVMLDLNTVSKQEALFPDPMAFKPERWLSGDDRLQQAFLAFGAGPRMCIGWRLAMLEAQIVLIRLLQRYRFELDKSKHQGGGLLAVTMGITMKPAAGGVWLVPRLRTAA